jgi:hypothetical protein
MIRSASPSLRLGAGGSPAADVEGLSVKRFGFAALRTANPSMAVVSNGGKSLSAKMSRESTLPQARERATCSPERGNAAPRRIVRAAERVITGRL